MRSLLQLLLSEQAKPYRVALVCWIVGLDIVCLGIHFGHTFVRQSPIGGSLNEPFLQAFLHWDGNWYARIATHGYEDESDNLKVTHFFPLYSLVSGALIRVGLSPALSMVLVSNLAFLGYLGVLWQLAPHHRLFGTKRTYLLMLASLFPIGLFFRVAYTESLFILLVAWQMWCFRKETAVVWPALAAGLATATRPTGIALALPLALYLWDRRKSYKDFVLQSLWVGPLALSGILFFMVYLGIAKGDPIAFSTVMPEWHIESPPQIHEKVLRLVSLQPVLEMMSPTSAAYWKNFPSTQSPLFSLYLMNGGLFLAGLLLMCYAAKKGWWSRYELALTAGLLGIAYWCAGIEVRMSGIARYVWVAVPLHLAATRLLCKMPVDLRYACLSVMAVMLFAYSALFSRWYWFV